MSRHAFGDGFLNPPPSRFGAKPSAKQTVPGGARGGISHKPKTVPGIAVAGAIMFASVTFASQPSLNEQAVHVPVATTSVHDQQSVDVTPFGDFSAEPDQSALTALGLDDASLDAAWDGVLAEIAASGRDPRAIVYRAAEVLTAWRDAPDNLANGFAAGDDKI